MAFYRWTVAVVVFLPFALKSTLLQWVVLKQHIVYLAVVSLLGVTLFNTLIYIAGQTTTAINLSLISITFPIFTVILSRFIYNEAITLNKVMGIVLVIIGVLLLVSKGQFSVLLNLTFAVGDVWMLMAALAFSIYSILLKQKPPTISVSSMQFSTFFIGWLFLLPFYLWQFQGNAEILLDKKVLYAILYLGVFASLIAFVLWNQSIQILGPTKAGLIYYSMPIFSGFLAFWFLGEAVTGVHLLSAMLIILGIIMASFKSPFKR